MCTSNDTQVLEKKLKGYGESDNFVAPRELTVTITLSEYRSLVTGKGVSNKTIDALERIVQLARGLRKAVGVYLRRVVVARMERILRNVDAHDVFKLHVELNALTWIQQSLLEHLRRHDGACDLQ